ncbi:hypothetical protein AGDE_13194 [Angomonas deanei]|nr:hypothetical protein AGDE_13194 [Angomonas deanei]|eukprot:EPY22561.1 hypothetical protein AGDE_13194 [Angomonas deanei]
MVTLKGASDAKDLLKDGASYGSLKLGSSPLYGPGMLGVEVKEITTIEEAVKVFDDGVKNATEPKEMICGYFVLQQVKKASNETAVYQSALSITITGEEVSHLTGLKDKSDKEPVKLYRYTVGGGCVSLCVGIVGEEDADAKKVVEVVNKMREVKNTAPRSGNVKRFIEYTDKEVEKWKQKESDEKDEGKKKNMKGMISRMEMMVKDAKEVVASPEKVAPKAY